MFQSVENNKEGSNREQDMETDLLNFKSEEYFTDLSNLQDKPDILERFGNDFSYINSSATNFRQDSVPSWMQEEEQEINGDLAVIPVAGHLEQVFPYLSTSPDCRDDFGRMLPEWQEHIGQFETSDEDLTISESFNDSSSPTLNNDFYYDSKSSVDINSVIADTEGNYDTLFNETETKIVPQFPNAEIQNPIENLEIPNFDGKINTKSEFDVSVPNDVVSNLDLKIEDNFDLIASELELNIGGDKSILDTSGDLESKDNFDLASYIINDDAEPAPTIADELNKADLLITHDILADSIDPKLECKIDEKKFVDIHPEAESGSHKELSSDKNIKGKNRKSETKNVTTKQVNIDEDDDCIDVVTVSPNGYHPVLEAGDLNSLLEQFEASEAVNSPAKDDEEAKVENENKATPLVYKKLIGKTRNIQRKTVEVSKKCGKDSSNKISLLEKQKENNCESIVKLKNSQTKLKVSNVNIKEQMTEDVIKKIKTNEKKRTIAVIPAMPEKKTARKSRIQNDTEQISKKVRRTAEIKDTKKALPVSSKDSVSDSTEDLLESKTNKIKKKPGLPIGSANKIRISSKSEQGHISNKHILTPSKINNKLIRLDSVQQKTKTASSTDKLIHLDHDYCSVSSKASKNVSETPSNATVPKEINKLNFPASGLGIGSKGIRLQDSPSKFIQTETSNSVTKIPCSANKNISNLIDDTALRIPNNSLITQKQISVSPKVNSQNRIVITQSSPFTNSTKTNQSLINVNKKSVLLKNTVKSMVKLGNYSAASYKNVNGKVMVSVLKMNNHLKQIKPNSTVSSPGKINVTTNNTVIDTSAINDTVTNNAITVTEERPKNVQDNENAKSEQPPAPKRKKLTMEEYKERRIINRTHSCENSRTSSPLHVSSGNTSPMINHSSFSLPVTAVSSPSSQPTTPLYEVENNPKPPVEKIKVTQEMLLKMAANLLQTPAKSASVVLPPPPQVLPVSNEKTIESQPAKVQKVKIEPPKPTRDVERMITLVSIGTNTDPENNSVEVQQTERKKTVQDSKIVFKIVKKTEPLLRHKVFDVKSSESDNGSSPEKKTVTKFANTKSLDGKSLLQNAIKVNNHKLKEIIKPILSANTKINSNSLISNITATILQNNTKNVLAKKPVPKHVPTEAKGDHVPEHGEDKTIVILYKDRIKPKMCSVEIQTELRKTATMRSVIDGKVIAAKDENRVVEKQKRQYRRRRDSSSSSCASTYSVRSAKKSNRRKSLTRYRRTSHRMDSLKSNRDSISLVGSRWSRSRSRSRSYSRSISRSYSRSSSSSSSSSRCRSRSRSLSHARSYSRRHRSHAHRQSRPSSNKYSRSCRRSRSRSSTYRYRRSRSPYRSVNRKGNSRESVEREKQRQVEERRVIYVGRLQAGTTRTELRKRFRKFGPIIDVSVHFREQGDNYGFVTFECKDDAYAAKEHGNDDPKEPHYDLSFGGRRAFCQTRYSDLDNSDTIEMSTYNRPLQSSSFDNLLRQAQAHLKRQQEV